MPEVVGLKEKRNQKQTEQTTLLRTQTAKGRGKWYKSWLGKWPKKSFFLQSGEHSGMLKC